MYSNTHSVPARPGRPDGPRDGPAALTTDVAELAVQDLDQLTDTVLAERVLGLRAAPGLPGRPVAQGTRRGGCRGAGGAEDGHQVGWTAAWLRGRLRMGAGAASGAVRTARALFRGPLAATAQAVCDGEISPAHARVLASGTRDLPEDVTVEAEQVLLAAAGRLDPPRLRRVLGHLQQVADPDTAEAERERRHGRRGLWLAPTWDGMVAVDGLLEAEAGQSLLAALDPWPARPTPPMPAAAANAAPMHWPSWPAAASRGAGCPRPVGSAPSCW